MSALVKTAVAPPVLSLEGALAHAGELVPKLRAQAPDAETARRIPDAIVRELNDSGLMRLLQPRRVGGSECEWVAMVDVSSELARGCGSTAWNWAMQSSHRALSIPTSLIEVA